MSDAPETIWAEPDGEDIIIHNGKPELDALIATGYLYEYRRADLPATDAQAMANPKVKALVEAARGLISYSEMGHFQTNDPVQTALDALSALEADT